MPKRLTYADLLERFPEETNQRIELIDGELLMPPAPSVRHQDVVLEIGVRLRLDAERRGGLVLASPMDVLLTEHDVVQPDVLYLLPEHAEGVERPLTRVDLAVEVSSPSTRRTDTVRKRELYERHGVPEYWFVDLDADRILVYRLEEGRYGEPQVLEPDHELTTPLLPGFSALVGDLLTR
ncbi:MAG TPA: Uma2 family endonuclease [Actinomycetota bacterium]